MDTTNKKNRTIKKRMNKKTKLILIVIFVLFISLIIYKLISPFYIIPSEIEELNENFNFQYKFTTPLEKCNFEEDDWKRKEGYGEIYYSNKNGDYLSFCGYPDLSNSFKLTYIDTENPLTSVFDISIGDDISKVDNTLKKYGYKCYDKDYLSAQYGKGRVDISIGLNAIGYSTDTEEYDYATVTSILIKIESTDWLLNGYYK